MAKAWSPDAQLHSGSLETGDVRETIPTSHVLCREVPSKVKQLLAVASNLRDNGVNRII